MHTKIKISPSSLLVHRLLLLFLGISFLWGGIVLTTHHTLFSSRWLIEWMLFSLVVLTLLLLLGISRHTNKQVNSFFLMSTGVLLGISLISGVFRGWSLLFGLIWGATGRGTYHQQKQWLSSRRYRSTRSYIGAQLVFRGSCMSFLTTASIMSTIGTIGINCNQLDNLFRFTGIQQDVNGGIGQRFGITETNIPPPPNSATSGVTGSTSGTPSLFFGMLKTEIYTLLREQKELLNHSICDLINKQLIAIQNRPGRQVAGIALLYFLIRPLMGIVLWVYTPFLIILRKCLTRAQLIKKHKRRGVISEQTL